MLDFIILCAVRAGSDGVNDGGGHEGESGAGDGAHQGDEEVQLGDGGGQAEGDQHQHQAGDVLELDVVHGLHPAPEIVHEDVHRHVELERVGEGDGQGHHHLHHGGQPESSVRAINI